MLLGRGIDDRNSLLAKDSTQFPPTKILLRSITGALPLPAKFKWGDVVGLRPSSRPIHAYQGQFRRKTAPSKASDRILAGLSGVGLAGPTAPATNSIAVAHRGDQKRNIVAATTSAIICRGPPVGGGSGSELVSAVAPPAPMPAIKAGGKGWYRASLSPPAFCAGKQNGGVVSGVFSNFIGTCPCATFMPASRLSERIGRRNTVALITFCSCFQVPANSISDVVS